MQNKPRIRKTHIIIVSSILLLALLLLSFIHLQNTATALSYQVQKSAAAIEELKRENTTYELQILKLTSPDRIEYLAREKLGMIEPNAVLLESQKISENEKSPSL